MKHCVACFFIFFFVACLVSSELRLWALYLYPSMCNSSFDFYNKYFRVKVLSFFLSSRMVYPAPIEHPATGWITMYEMLIWDIS
jgi:hypothetical protein